jgi:N6-L-threonylcarbamoyladenine synthase
VNKGAVLGIDTSNYRTSFCLIDESGTIISEEKEWLSVKIGERGLAQSEAVFAHIKKMAELVSRLSLNGTILRAVCASTKPRPLEGSYMPVFKVGETVARIISHFQQIPFYETTHQEGHIAAGEFSAKQRPQQSTFLAVHLSGGTSDLLKCKRTEAGYEIEKLGGSVDLHAGQLIDRLGVALGLPFPAGPWLEQLAKQSEGSFRVPSSVNGLSFSFSGPATALLRAKEKQAASDQDLARAAEQCIANTLEKVLKNAVEQTGIKEILLVGGVAANQYILGRLKSRLTHRAIGAVLYEADPKYAGDNAFGCARIGLLKWKKEELH